MGRRTIGLAVLLMALAGAPAMALAEPGLAARGRAIAEGRCAVCHAVGREGASPQRGVPPFRELGQRFPIEMLQEALITGTVSGHDEMPATDLGTADVRSLLAYIDSLNPDAPAYLAAPRK